MRQSCQRVFLGCKALNKKWLHEFRKGAGAVLGSDDGPRWRVGVDKSVMVSRHADAPAGEWGEEEWGVPRMPRGAN